MTLRTKLTGFFILSAILGIGAVLFFQGMLVRHFVSETLLERQYSEASYIAAEIDDELRLRLDWVGLIANRITPEIMADPALLAQFLKDRQIATKLFNGGIYVLGTDGVCIANHPAQPQRIGVNYADRDYFQIAMREKRAVVGKPVMGRTLKQPTVTIATPILDGSGKVIGVFAGAITYSNVNFLGRLPSLRHIEGKQRIYVYAPSHGVIVSASDPGNILRAQPVNPSDLNVFAHMGNRTEGKYAVSDQDGHVLTSAVQHIPSADWRVILVTPNDTIFAGINRISLIVYLGALLLSLLLGIGVWLGVKRLFRPLDEATQRISSMMRTGSDRLHPLPAGVGDEVGKLIESFNALQERVSQSDQALRALTSQLEQRVEEEVKSNREKDHILIQQSRLAAMGEMIHNIAHQWRQPLSALALVIQNIKDDFEYHELTQEKLDDAVARSLRLLTQMSGTIDDFRNFFRPDQEPQPFDVAEAIMAALGVMDATLQHASITVSQELPAGLKADGYVNQFSQAVLNLIANAKEAIQARQIADGHIHIQLEERGGQAIITLRDNGGGIPPEALAHLYEPYFTTKEQGSGIGLYMSKMIIERNLKGKLELASQGNETTATITLPLLLESTS